MYTDDVKLEVPLVLQDGTEFVWKVASPQGLLRKMLSISPVLRDVVQRKWLSQPGVRWTIILYHDEVTPGNIAAPQNLRKFTAFYMSFVELGELLQHSCFWMHIGFIRSIEVVNKYPGGLSRICRLLWRHILLSDENFHSSGVLLTINEDHFVVHADPGSGFGDLDSLWKTFDAKNDSGTRPCMLCLKTLKKGTLTDPSSGLKLDKTFVEIDCLDEGKFVGATDATVWQAMDTLVNTFRAGKTSATQFEKIEQSHGFSCNPAGLLMDLELRRLVKPVSMYTMDWPHIYLCQGIGGSDLCNLLKMSRTRGFSYGTFYDWCGPPWVWPKYESQKGVKCRLLFTEGREEATKTNWKSDASEFLMVAPLVLYFCQTVLANDKFGGYFADAIESFEKLCYVIDLFQAIKKGRVKGSVEDISAKLRTAILEHLRASQKAFGVDGWRPKHHKAMHLWRQFLRLGCLFDSLPLEREHQVPKAFGTQHRNKTSWEESVLVRSLANQFNQLADLDITPGLRGKKEHWDHLGALVGSHLYYFGTRVSVGDILIMNDCAVVVDEGTKYTFKGPFSDGLFQ